MTPTRFTASLGLVSILLVLGPGAVAAQNASPGTPGPGGRTDRKFSLTSKG